jgi:hypothetical protein
MTTRAKIVKKRKEKITKRKDKINVTRGPGITNMKKSLSLGISLVKMVVKDHEKEMTKSIHR